MLNIEFSYDECKFIEVVESNEERIDWSSCGKPFSWREILDAEEEYREECYLA